MNENENPQLNPTPLNNNQTVPPQPTPQAPTMSAPPTFGSIEDAANQSTGQQNPYTTPQPATPTETSRGMFDRRINRLGFFLGFLYLTMSFILLFSVPFFVMPLIGGGGFGEDNIATMILNIIVYILGIVLFVLIIPVILSLYVRRLHDLNKSWVWILLILIPLIDIIFGLYLLFAPGDEQVNQYGEPVDSLNFLVVLGLKRPA